MIVGSCYRFSLLTARLVRMEYDPDGVFEDRPTQMAVNRSFPPVEYAVYETDQHLEIITDALNIFYDKGPFTVHSLQVKVRSECCGIYCTWNYSEPVMEGLGGTAQTLDQADGEIPLEPGIQSRIGGFGVLDDSRSAVIRDLSDSSFSCFFLQNQNLQNRINISFLYHLQSDIRPIPVLRNLQSCKTRHAD